MKHLLIVAALSLTAVPAIAGQCTMDMAKIDAAMETANLTEAEMAEVAALRAEGEALHEAGDHDASIETLAKAKAMLDLE